MVTDLQKASLWKRLSAGLFDLILIVMLAVGIATALSWAVGYNSYSEDLSKTYLQYGTQYGVELGKSVDFDALPQEQKDAYYEAYEAWKNDPEVIYLSNMVANLSLLITTFSILITVLLLEFGVPLLLKNGQTLGKKIFGVALMRTDGVKVSSVQMFIRTVLGKFTIEIMIPVYILMMIFFNTIGIIAIAILGAIAVAELLSLMLSKTGSLIHDSIAGTVAVDMASQQIFESPEERVEYIKRLHAEEASRQEY